MDITVPETLGSLNLGARYTDRDTEAQTRDGDPWGHTASQRLSWVSDMLQAETQFPADGGIPIGPCSIWKKGGRLSGAGEVGRSGAGVASWGLDQSPCPWWASVYKSVQWADAVRGAAAG